MQIPPKFSSQILFIVVYYRAASEFCKLSGLLCSYGLYQVVLSEQLCLYCRGNTSEFSARLVLVDQKTGASEFVMIWSYRGSESLYSMYKFSNLSTSLNTEISR